MGPAVVWHKLQIIGAVFNRRQDKNVSLSQTRCVPNISLRGPRKQQRTDNT
jgi:hypothetical protein